MLRTSTFRKKHLFLGGFASECIVMEFTPQHHVEVMFNPARYSTSDLERVVDHWQDGVYSYLIEIEPGQQGLVHGSLAETIQVLRSKVPDLAPASVQRPVCLQDATPSYYEFRQRMKLRHSKPRRRSW